MALGRYTSVVVDNAGNAISGAAVLVQDRNGNSVDIFSDRAGATALANPFQAGDGDPDPRGRFSFYTAVGWVRITVGSGAAQQTYERFIQDRIELDEFSELADLRSADCATGDLVSVLKGDDLYECVTTGEDLDYSGDGGLKFKRIKTQALILSDDNDGGFFSDAVGGDRSRMRWSGRAMFGDAYDFPLNTFGDRDFSLGSFAQPWADKIGSLDEGTDLSGYENATQLNGALSDNAAITTITVDDTTGFTDTGLLKIGLGELVRYTGKTATTFTGCVRGYDPRTQAQNEDLVFAAADNVTVAQVIEGSRMQYAETFGRVVSAGDNGGLSLAGIVQVSNASFGSQGQGVMGYARLDGGNKNAFAFYPEATRGRNAKQGGLWVMEGAVSDFQIMAETTLDGAIDDTTTTVALAAASGLGPAGFVQIGAEVISYTGKDGNTLEGVTRSVNGVEASHSDGATAQEVKYTQRVNPYNDGFSGHSKAFMANAGAGELTSNDVEAAYHVRSRYTTGGILKGARFYAGFVVGADSLVPTASDNADPTGKTGKAIMLGEGQAITWSDAAATALDPFIANELFMDGDTGALVSNRTRAPGATPDLWDFRVSGSSKAKMKASTHGVDMIVNNGTATQTFPLVRKQYATRALFKADVDAGATWPDGTVITAGGYEYEADSTATHLLGLSGFREHGPLSMYHLGAVGDGVADDTDAAVLFFAETGRKRPGAGTFRCVIDDPIDRRIEFATGDHIIEGEGPEFTTFFVDRGVEQRQNFIAGTATNIKITGCTFKGNRGDGDYYGETPNFTGALWAVECTNFFWADDCVWRDCNFFATTITSGKYGAFTNCKVINSRRDGLRLVNFRHTLHDGNYIEGCMDDGIVSTIYDSDEVNPYPEPTDRTVIITNNTFYKAQGARVIGAKNVTITGNVYDFPSRLAISIGPGSSAESGNTANFNVTINDNIITNLFPGDFFDGDGSPGRAIYIDSRPISDVSSDGAFAWHGDGSDGVNSPLDLAYQSNLDDGGFMGVWNVSISGNKVLRTIEETSPVQKFSDYGFGTLYSKDGPIDPNVTEAVFADVDGIVIEEATYHGIIESNQVFHGGDTCMVLQGAGSAAQNGFMGLTLRGNSLKWFNLRGLQINGEGNVNVIDNEFDGDPLFVHPDRGIDGKWTSATSMGAFEVAGGVKPNFIRNHIKNVGAVLKGDTGYAGYNWSGNLLYCRPDAAGVGTSAADNQGIRGIWYPAGLGDVIIEDGDVESADYGRVENATLTGALAQPTSGYYVRGQYVKDILPSIAGSAGNKYIVKGWTRLTTGSGHVADTDWLEDREWIQESGTFTASITDNSGNKNAANDVTGSYKAMAGQCVVTIPQITVSDITGMTSGDTLRLTLPSGFEPSADFAQGALIRIMTSLAGSGSALFWVGTAGQDFLRLNNASYTAAANTQTIANIENGVLLGLTFKYAV